MLSDKKVPNNIKDKNSYKTYEKGISAPEMIKESQKRGEFERRTPNFVKEALKEVSQ